MTCHIQDLPENGADVAHLAAIHSESFLGGGDPTHWLNKLMAWNWHEWSISWAQETEEGQKHIAVANLMHALRIGKHSIFKLKVNIRFSL